MWRRVGPLVATVLVAVAVAACGGGDQPTTQAASTAAPGARDMDPAQRQKIDQCLQAAGIPVPTQQPRPSGEPRPSGQPRPSGGARAGGGQFADPKVQQALQACGITLPQGGRRGAGSTAAPATAGA
ncbi:MAG: hypothetical protein ABS81_22905 [Pseudonocardia sp. SCN 72-86]|nr:MAG: hypothetical protein ABS81_22905 [Pseudonocardia sp. SCN 72-86]